MKKRSYLERRLEAFITSRGLPTPTVEFRFAPPRLWRFDFAWPDRGIAIEVEGGIWMQGRHNRGVGMNSDAEKYNAATLAGWRVYRVTTDMFKDRSVFELVQHVLTTPHVAYVPTVLTECREEQT